MTREAERFLVFPVFTFERRRELEIENVELAGTLRYNSFGRSPTRKQQRELAKIINGLTHDARSGRLPLDGEVVVGWGGGSAPLDAADVTNETIMGPWRRRAFVVAVRVTRMWAERMKIPPGALADVAARE